MSEQNKSCVEFVQRAGYPVQSWNQLSLFLVGICQLKVLNMAKSLPRKVKVGFSFALGSQPFCLETTNDFIGEISLSPTKISVLLFPPAPDFGFYFRKFLVSRSTLPVFYFDIVIHFRAHTENRSPVSYLDWIVLLTFRTKRNVSIFQAYFILFSSHLKKT